MCVEQTRGISKDWDVIAALAVQNHRRGRDAEDKEDEETMALTLYWRLARCGASCCRSRNVIISFLMSPSHK